VPVLDFVERALDLVAPAVFGSVVRGEGAAVALGRIAASICALASSLRIASAS
jgi:hypothetical protein